MENKVFAKAAWRLIPFMILLYVGNYLDRVNVGFAALTMNADLGIDEEAFGIVGGIFFLGYFLFEVPSNVVLEKVGARLWICRIMLSWGLVSAATAFVGGAVSLSALRFLLGIAEAGFFPGVIFYLSAWFPDAMRARFVALFLAAVPLATIVGAPLSGLILGMDGAWGLRGWQWLFLLEGVPSCLLAFATLLYLPNGPAEARWLTREEKDVIAARLAADPAHTHHALVPMLRDVRVWLLALPDFGIVVALYGLSLWLPQIVKQLGYSNLATGAIVALPYVAAIVAAILWCRSSDRSGERVRHVALAALLGAGGMIAASLTLGSPWCIAALAVAASGIMAAISTFWALPSSFLRGTAAAGGIALINSLANLGGFAGPYLMGWLRKSTGGFAVGLDVLAAGLVMTAVTILIMGHVLGFGKRAPARIAT